jgi:adenosine deaminase
VDCDHAIDRLKKADLHVHLTGLVSTDLIRSIVREEEAEIPAGFDVVEDLVRGVPCASLNIYLKPWRLLRRIPSKISNLHRMCDDAFQTLHDNNVELVELRSSVLYLAGLQGCSVPEALRRVIDATGMSAEKFGINRGMLLTVPRGNQSSMHLATLLDAYAMLGRPPEVVGIDLAGDEDSALPEDLPRLFREAKEKYGLGITIHAGETGRVESVLSAVRQFDADRIGHGTAAAAAPEVMEELRERDVCVEVCPISNRLSGAIRKSESHPLREFQQHGVPFVICSDNPGIHGRGLNEDYAAAVAEGVDLPTLEKQYSVALKHTFLRHKPNGAIGNTSP